MSSLENIYQKMTPTWEAPNFSNSHDKAQSEPKQIGSEVAHELNNILAIIQGYSDRLMLKHRDDALLQPDLQLISQNTRRAAAVIRRAVPSRPQMQMADEE